MLQYIYSPFPINFCANKIFDIPLQFYGDAFEFRFCYDAIPKWIKYYIIWNTLSSAILFLSRVDPKKNNGQLAASENFLVR